MKTPWELSKSEFIIVICCIFCSFLTTFNIVMVSSNLSAIQDMFHTTDSLVSAFSQTVSLMYITFFLLSIAITDKLGKKFSMIAGLALLCVSSALCALANDIISLTVFRMFVGMGIALMQTSCLSVVTDIVSKKYLGEAMSFTYAASSIGAVAAPLLSVFIVNNFGLKMLFILSVPVSLVVIFLVRNMDNVKTRPDMKIDWPMNIAYMISAFMIILPLLYPRLPYRWAVLVIGIVLFAVFILLYVKSKNRNFDIGIFRIKAFAFSAVLAFIMTFCYREVEDCLSQMFQFADKDFMAFGIVISTATFAAVLLSVKPLIQTIISPMLGRYYRNRSAKNAMVVGFLFLIGSTVLAVVSTHMSPSEAWVILVVMVYVLHAFSSSVFTPQNKKIMMTSVPAESRNAASSFSSVISTIGGIVSGIMISNLLSKCATTGGYQTASLFLFILVLLISAIGLALVIWRNRKYLELDG